MAQTRKPTLRTVRPPASVYRLRVELMDLKPAIWRQILVPGSIKLPKLRRVLQEAMGWEGAHLHEFVFGDTSYGQPDPDLPNDPPMLNEARVTLTTALGALRSFIYIYDYGDDWRHRVKVEKVLPPDSELRSPLCLAGCNACPPEDVGGVPGYIEFLDAINDPSHEEHRQMLDWCGGGFDPSAFDLDGVNLRLSGVKL